MGNPDIRVFLCVLPSTGDHFSGACGASQRTNVRVRVIYTFTRSARYS